MIVVGITGGVGCGKSRVLEYLEANVNGRILLADQVAHLLKEPGTEVFGRLIELLGREILAEDGSIDRMKMAKVIFSDHQKLSLVNGMIHPAVKQYILDAVEEERKKGEIAVFFIEAALLIEGGYRPWLDELWYIYSDEAVRMKRLREGRGYSEEKIRSIMEQQLTEEEFHRYADVVIDNSGNFSDTCVRLSEECRRLGIWK